MRIRPDGRCLRGHQVGTTGAKKTCPTCEIDRARWLAVFDLFARDLRRRGLTVHHKPRTTRMTVGQ